jgi:hypothetical protein
MRKPRRLIYTKDLSLKEKHQPAYHRGLFLHEIERCDEVLTDMPEVKEAYDKVEGIKVTWIGKQKSVKKKAVKKHVGLRDDSRSG